MRFFVQIPVLIALVMGSLLTSPVALGKSIYVNDNLRVGVREEPNNRVAPFSVVVTGMKLEVLDETNGYMKIKTAKGEVGWVRDIYVSNTPPAMLRIKSLKDKFQAQQQQLQELEEATNILEMTNRGLLEQIDGLKQERSRLQMEKARNAYLLQDDSPSQFWWWIMLGCLLLGGAAFSSGIIWYRQQAMKRLGGLRV